MKLVQELPKKMSDQAILLVHALWGTGSIPEKGVDIMWIDLVHSFLMRRFFSSTSIYFYHQKAIKSSSAAHFCYKFVSVCNSR